MKRSFLSLTFLCLFCLPVQASTYYASTSGSGTTCSSASRCSITYAVGTKAATADDIVEVGSGTYDVCGLTPNSGTSGHPIVVRSESDLGAVVKCTTAGGTSLVGPFEIKDTSYVRIGGSGHGFDFNGSTNLVVIDVWQSVVNQAGIEILYNTFQNNGNQGFTANGGSGNAARQINVRRTGSTFQLTAALVNNNTFTGNYGRGLLWNSAAGTIDSNTDTLRKSSQDGPTNGYFFIAQFFHGGQGGAGTTVSNNTIATYTKDSYVSTTPPYCNGGAGGLCKYAPNPLRTDTGASNVMFLSNLIYDIDAAATGNTQGIFTESSCDDNVASYNRIYRIGGVAMKMGSYNTGQNTGNLFSWNSIFDCKCGIQASNATNYTIKNNIVQIKTGSGAAAMRTDHALVNGIWNNNDLFNQNTSNIGKTPASTSGACDNADKALAAWDTAVSGTSELSSDPLYVNVGVGTEDLNLQGGSPAIHTADDGSNMGFNPLANPPPFATITVISPNGGDNLKAGNIIPISWVTTQSGNCKIELSRDSGSTYSEVVTSSTVCTNQTYSWTVTPPRGTTDRIKVTSLNDGTVTDSSDADFTIHGKYFKILQ